MSNNANDGNVSPKSKKQWGFGGGVYNVQQLKFVWKINSNNNKYSNSNAHIFCKYLSGKQNYQQMEMLLLADW